MRPGRARPGRIFVSRNARALPPYSATLNQRGAAMGRATPDLFGLDTFNKPDERVKARADLDFEYQSKVEADFALAALRASDQIEQAYSRLERILERLAPPR